MIQRHFAGGLLCLLAWLPIAHAQAPRADVQARAPSPADVDVLNRHNWRLIRAVPSPFVGPLKLPQNPEQQPVVRFQPRASAHAGLMFVSKLCNGAGIAYRLDSNRRIHEVHGSNLAFTAMSCGDEMNALERRMQLQLRQIHSYAVLTPQGKSPPQLALRFSDGALWMLEGSPTLEALHGPAVELRLQVAPELVPCVTPDGAAPVEAACLQVRRVQKTDALCPTPLEDWQVYRGQIQGFNHAPGYRYELDIKRYIDRTGPPGERLIDVKVGMSATMVGDVRKLFGERAKNMAPFSFDRCQ